MKSLAILLGLAAALVLFASLILATSGNEASASQGPELVSVFGESEVQGQRVIVHIVLVVPPGLDIAAAKANALAAQRARPLNSGALLSSKFVTSGLGWDQFSDSNPGNDFVTQNYNPSNQPNGGALTALQNSENAWTAVPTSKFAFSYGGTTTRCPSLVLECPPGSQVFDGFNDVGWLELAGATTLGITWWGDTTDEADMALNTKFTWNVGCTDVSASFDIQTVFTHENGHVAGLAHSSVSGSVMEANYAGARCTLRPDDIAGISSLYPGTDGTGSISASPNPCTFASGATTCTTTIDWSTEGASAAQVWVQDPNGWGGVEQPMIAGVSGTIAVPWIQGSPHQYTFRLYNTSNSSKVLLKTVVVSGSAPSGTGSASGTVSASPNPCQLTSSACTTNVSWSTQGASAAQVWVQDPNGWGGIEQPMVGGTSGTIAVPWIQGSPHQYTFTLYNTSVSPKVPLNSVVVTASASPSGLIALPNPCKLASGACTTNVTWSTQNVAAAQVWVWDPNGWGGIEQPMVAGTSGTIAVPWIQGAPHQYTFTLYNTSVSPKVPLTSIVVTGVP